MPPRIERKLAAILAADVVGYSRLVGADEAGTIARLKALRTEAIEPLIAEYRGRVVKLMGDGALVEFASAVDAVECAVAIQKTVEEREAAVPEDRRIEFRIGINVGDIIVEDGDILGDGVNVAARLEGLAEPGGICVARNVHNQIKAKLALPFEPMGEHRVKNIAEPVEVWRVLLDGTAPKPKATVRRFAPTAIAAGIAVLLALGGVGAWWWHGSGTTEAAALPLPDQPSIAVLPFDNLSGDPTEERFADGITEDIITDLSRFRDLFVIARNSTAVYKDKAVDVRQVGHDLGVRYVLEGSLQSTPERVRVTAQLIDATTGAHVWGDRYDRPFEDLLTIQSDVAETIAGTLGAIQGGRGALRKQELERSSNEEKIAALTAYDYFLRGIMYVDKFTPEDNLQARDLFTKAIELRPNYGRARAKLAMTYLLEYMLGWSTSPEKTLQQGVELAQTAIAADESESWAHWSLGFGYLLQKRYDEGLIEYARAVALNPNDADVLSDYGWALATAGKAVQGVESGRRAMRLNPFYPGWYLWNLGMCQYDAHQYEEAVATLEAFHEHNVQSRLFLAASYGQLGRAGDAKQQVAEALKLVPGYTHRACRRTRRSSRARQIWSTTSTACARRACQRAGLRTSAASGPTPWRSRRHPEIVAAGQSAIASWRPMAQNDRLQEKSKQFRSGVTVGRFGRRR